jgi:hypothetical protein
MREADTQTNKNWFRVEDPRACTVLTDRALLCVLGQFMGQESTISKAANNLKMTVTAVYKLVKRFEALRLIRVVRSEARNGRPTRFYRSVAESFFIPFRTHPIESISQQNWALHQTSFRRGLERLYREERFVEQDWGVCTTTALTGEVYLEITSGSDAAWDYLNPEAPAVLSGWNPVFLDFEDAKAMQAELMAVALKYMEKRGARKYLLGLFMTDVDGVE